MIKVHILTTCEQCNSEAYLPTGEAESYTGEHYTRYHPCPRCNGSGNQAMWVSLQALTELARGKSERKPLKYRSNSSGSSIENLLYNL